MEAGGKPGNASRRILFLVALLVCLLIVLIVAYCLGFGKPAPSTVADGQAASSQEGPDGKVWYKTTKVTGGSVNPMNDIYVTMGLEVPNKADNRSGCLFAPNWATAVYGAGKWQVPLIIACVASARANGTDEPENFILSQTLDFAYPRVKSSNDFNNEDNGRMDITSGSFEAWPSQESSPSTWIDDMSESTLYRVIMDRGNHQTNFPLSPSDFGKSQGVDIWNGYISGPDAEQHPEIFYRTNFLYEQKLGKDISDCGFTSEVRYLLSPGKTYDLELTTVTWVWGLAPEVKLHVQITAPPDPTGMSASQLSQFGITPSGGSLYPGQQYLYWINASKLAITTT